MKDVVAANRRKFLKYLAASPLLAQYAPDLLAADDDIILPQPKFSDPLVWAPLNPSVLIKEPKDAINVFDFELAARQTIPPTHFGYMASGIDDEVTLRANREDFLKFKLQPHRLNDVSRVDTKVELFGITYDSPVFLCPIGVQEAFGAGGEATAGAGAKKGNHMQMLSTHASASIEDVMEARGAPVWFQLYATNNVEVGIKVAQRAQSAGAPVMAITIDRTTGRNQETRARIELTDPRTCSDCHTQPRPRASFRGIDTKGVQMISSNLTWDKVKRIRDSVKMKTILKGILTAEDAQLALEAGFDGIMVSNHGGRAEDSGQSSIEALPRIMEVVKDRVPVIIDSGFRRGTDVVKALAMGVKACGIGRPYIWGLGSFGEEGVQRVLEIIQTETVVAMGQCGAPNIQALNPSFVRRA